MFTYKKLVNFYDCDPAGILFYARIYELTHAAYEGMIESLKLEEDYWANDDYVVPIIHSEAKYRNPITFGQEITINLSVTQLKNSSFELQYECINENDELCVEVKTVHVFIGKDTWKKKPMSQPIKKGLMKYIGLKEKSE